MAKDAGGVNKSKYSFALRNEGGWAKGQRPLTGGLGVEMLSNVKKG